MTKNPNSPTYSADINVSGITVRNRLRKLNKDKVNELMTSIASSLLLQPIIVTPNNDSGRGYILVAGRHRLEAVKKLGRRTIKAEVIKRLDAFTEEEKSDVRKFNG